VERITGPAAALDPIELRRWVVDCLVASLQLAQLEEFEDSEMDRYQLTSWCQDFFDGRVVDLTMMWNLVLSKPGTEIEDAALPLAIFQASAPRHGLPARLPEGFELFPGYARVSDIARRRLGAAGDFLTVAANVGARRFFDPETAPIRYDTTSVQATGPLQQFLWAAPSGSRLKKVLTVLTVLAVVVGLAGLAAAVWLGLWAQTTPFDLASTQTILRLERATRQGDHVRAWVADERWESMDDAPRRQALRELYDRLALQGVRQVTLLEPNGGLAALADGRDGALLIQVGEELHPADSAADP
jgi:hypothetical protein